MFGCALGVYYAIIITIIITITIIIIFLFIPDRERISLGSLARIYPSIQIYPII